MLVQQRGLGGLVAPLTRQADECSANPTIRTGQKVARGLKITGQPKIVDAENRFWPRDSH